MQKAYASVSYAFLKCFIYKKYGIVATLPKSLRFLCVTSAEVAHFFCAYMKGVIFLVCICVGKHPHPEKLHVQIENIIEYLIEECGVQIFMSAQEMILR